MHSCFFQRIFNSNVGKRQTYEYYGKAGMSIFKKNLKSYKTRRRLLKKLILSGVLNFDLKKHYTLIISSLQ